MSLNKVMIIGRLGREPELKYTQSGSPVCTFSVATDESYTDNSGQKVEKAEWHRIVVFQKAAENCSQYLAKGSLVFIEGRLETRKWQMALKLSRPLGQCGPCCSMAPRGRIATSPRFRGSASSSSTARRTGSPASSRKAGAGSKADATPLPHPLMKTSAPPSRPRPPVWTMFLSSKTNRIQP